MSKGLYVHMLCLTDKHLDWMQIGLCTCGLQERL